MESVSKLKTNQAEKETKRLKCEDVNCQLYGKARKMSILDQSWKKEHRKGVFTPDLKCQWYISISVAGTKKHRCKWN